jgi:allantoate deiminase
MRIDREKSAARIAADVEELSGPAFTSRPDAVCRYAYTPQYRATLDWFRQRFDQLGYAGGYDPVGTFFARNRPAGEPAFGIGSHCDSNRNGGKWDGTMGVVVGLELCRLNRDLDLGLPLQVISWLEEEGSAFGRVLLGSMIMAQRLDEDELRHGVHALDDGRSFWEHATEAGHAPERWRESIHVLDGLRAWVEVHIEQGRVLQDYGQRIGVVEAIAGCLHADVTVEGRADHAGSTPMDLRRDAGVLAAECVVELERLGGLHPGLVATVGEMEFAPGFINVIPGRARLSVDIRSVDDAAVTSTAEALEAFVQRRAADRGLTATLMQRQVLPATPLDAGVAGALEAAASEAGVAHRRMASGAAHDTVCVAPIVPSAMIFTPCLDGISHNPAERADPADAAVAVEMALNAFRAMAAAS